MALSTHKKKGAGEDGLLKRFVLVGTTGGAVPEVWCLQG